MKSGAIEFLTKPIKDEALLDAIRDGLARSSAALSDDAEIGLLTIRYTSLTPRERDVMKLVVSGLLNKQIAGELDVEVDGVLPFSPGPAMNPPSSFA
jgi:FixJ family two-component response regulator